MIEPFNLSKNNVWIFSDPHYRHENICSSTTKWNLEKISEGHSGVRLFNSIEEMDKAIVDGINEHVKKDDILICLGDWSFGGENNIFNFRKQIVCRNIHLILGNHDHHIARNILLPANQQIEALNLGFTTDSSGVCIRAKDLFSSVEYFKQIKVQLNSKSKAIMFNLMHYSMRVWDKHHHGAYHLFGHSHGSLDNLPNGRSMDVGIDSAYKLFKTYRPFNILECIDICNKNEIQYIDHHIAKSN